MRIFRAPAPPAPALYHLHIPKAAGTALFDLLRSRFPRRKVCPVRLSSLDLLRIPPDRFARYDLIGGHLEFGYHLPELTGRPVRPVVLLREPRSLLLSLYKQLMHEPLDPLRAHVDAHCPTLEAFFFDPLVSRYVANPQTRFLAVTERRFTLDVVRRLRAATPEASRHIVQQTAESDPDLSPFELLDRARRRLDDCAAVGLVERFEESCDRICAALGWPSFARPKTRNVSPLKIGRDQLPRHVAARLDELTTFDRALYQDAAARFGEEMRPTALRRAA
jgi:hypothetical protein